jgi:hypothetical protein
MRRAGSVAGIEATIFGGRQRCLYLRALRIQRLRLRALRQQHTAGGGKYQY